MKKTLAFLLSVAMVLTMGILIPFGSAVSAEEITYGATNAGQVASGYTPDSSATAIWDWNDLTYYISEDDPAGNYYLAADITTPTLLKFALVGFSGTLDGNGHTITTTAPLFDSLNGATIKNLTVVSTFEVDSDKGASTKDPDNKDALAAGAIARLADGAGATLINVKVDANITVPSTNTGLVSAAGFIGSAAAGNYSFTNCELVGTISNEAKTGYASGYMLAKSGASGNWTFDHCTVGANIKGTSKSGGFSGDTRNAKITMTNCLQSGTMQVASNSGGFLGYLGGSGSLTATDCKNVGNITSTACAGGIVGKADCVVTITACINDGDVSGTGGGDNGVGGILGAQRSNKASKVTNCVNNGDITSQKGAAGSIVGMIRDDCAMTVTGCTNTGVVSSGLIGTNGIVGATGAMSAAHIAGINNNTDTANNEIDVKSFAPAQTPFGDYEVGFRLGLDSESAFASLTGNSVNNAVTPEAKPTFGSTNAVYGNAVTFGAQAGSKSGEIQLKLNTGLAITGCTGVMFHVDFSQTVGNAPQATVTLNANNVRSNVNSKAGYYQDGDEWVGTNPGTADRMILPAQYVGWVYIPAYSFTASYTSGSTTYSCVDSSTGKFASGLSVNNLNLYTDGYTFNENARITYDEILFVTGSNGFRELNAVDDTNLRSDAPTLLPDGTPYDAIVRNGFDDGACSKYWLEKSSKAPTESITADGAQFTWPGSNYGAETYMNYKYPFSIKGAKGVLFYVDFSTTTPQSGYHPAATVTINNNDYRSNAGSKNAFYYVDGEWIGTTATNADRMGLPDYFVGWVYIPATSYTASIVENGLFKDVTVYNNRFYTQYAATGSDGYISFDEIMFVKAADAKFISAQGTIGTDLTLDFTAYIDPNLVGDISVKFTRNNKSVVVDGEAGAEANTFVFSYTGINPQCMGDEILAELYLGEEVIATKTYSFKQYVENVMSDYEDNTAMLELCVATLKYGAAAQVYAQYKTDALVNEEVKTHEFITALPEFSYNMEKTDSGAVDAEVTGAGIYFDNALHVYFTVTSEASSLKVLLDDEVVEPTMISEGVYRVISKPIAVRDIENSVEITLFNGDIQGQTVTYSITDYMLRTYARGTASEAMTGLLDALSMLYATAEANA